MTAAEGPSAGEAALPALPSLCPYLATAEGSWRSARAVPEHRCTAVSPPVPLAADKQRRLCLVEAHTSCATYGAAMAARAEPIEQSGHSRPIARMTPVILDQGRFDVRVPAWRTDRTSQGLLVGILGVAFAAILFARPADPAGAGPFMNNPSALPGGSLESSDPGRAEPTDQTSTETDDPAAATDISTDSEPPEASAGSGGQASPASTTSAEPATSGATYRVKSGDTLSAIAARFGTTTRVLVRLNDIADPSKLRIGQVLKLP
jgi:LysM repeat protein